MKRSATLILTIGMLALAGGPASALSARGEDRAPATSDLAVPMPNSDGRVAAGSDDDGPTEILSDVDSLPEPVRRMRARILEACRNGDLEGLRALMGSGDSLTQLSLGETEEDPIDFLKAVSGDGEGYEIMAILAEVLEEDFVRLDAGTSRELYVWPYFFAYPLEQLDGPQRVRLFRLVTAADYEDMLAFGGYNFYRAGITPDGRWAIFVAGD